MGDIDPSTPPDDNPAEDPSYEDDFNNWNETENQIQNCTDCSEIELQELKNTLNEQGNDIVRKVLQDTAVDGKGVDWGEKIDTGKPLTEEAQKDANLTPEEVKSMNNFVDKFNNMWDQIKTKLNLDGPLDEINKKYGLTRDSDGNLQMKDPTQFSDLMKDVEDLARSKVEEIEKAQGNESDDSKKESKIKKLLKWLFGLLALVSPWLIRYGLCKAAHSQSGCRWYPPDGSGYLKVGYNNLAPSYCNSFNTCCGKCDGPNIFKGWHSSLQSACAGGKCCSASVDADSKDHQGGKYEFRCISISHYFTEAWNDVKDVWEAPQKLFNTLIRDIIILAVVILGLVVLYYILRAIFKRKKGGEEIEMTTLAPDHSHFHF